jgi:hypothetical protein
LALNFASENFKSLKIPEELISNFDSFPAKNSINDNEQICVPRIGKDGRVLVLRVLKVVTAVLAA